MVGNDYPGAFVVQCVIAIEDESLHRSHFWVRDQATEGLRPLEKYLDSLTADPRDPGLPRRARPAPRRPGDLQRLARHRDRRRARPRPAPRRSARRSRMSAVDAPSLNWPCDRARGRRRGTSLRRGPRARHGHRRAGAHVRRRGRRAEGEGALQPNLDGLPGRRDDRGRHRDAARGVPGVTEVEAELTFDPPWTPDRMSEDAKFILGFG